MRESRVGDVGALLPVLGGQCLGHGMRQRSPQDVIDRRAMSYNLRKENTHNQLRHDAEMLLITRHSPILESFKNEKKNQQQKTTTYFEIIRM